MSSLLRAAIFGLAIGIGGFLLSHLPFVQQFEEDLGLGLLFKLRGVKEPPRDVVIVSIDRDSAEQLKLSGNPSRWPRAIHARLVELLTRAGAKVITFDVYFTEPRAPDDDRRFAAAMRSAGNVVLAEPLRARDLKVAASGQSRTVDHKIIKTEKPIATLLEAAAASAPFVLPRLPVKVSKYWTFQAEAGDTPTFPVVAFQLFALADRGDFIRLLEKAGLDVPEALPRTPVDSSETVRWIRQIRTLFERDPELARKLTEELESFRPSLSGAGKYPLLKSLVHLYGGQSHRFLNFYGPPRTIRTLSYQEVLDWGQEHSAVAQLDLQGKAVFVGLSEILSTEKEDSFYTVFPNPNGVFLSGVEIAATAFANLVEDAQVRPTAGLDAFWVLLIWGLVIGIICRLLPILGALLVVPCLSGAYLMAAYWQFASYNAWYPIIIPLFVQNTAGLLSAACWNYIEIHRERQNVRGALAFYVPSDVVNQLAKDILDLKKGDQTVYGVCLFTDATGYTGVSEAMSAADLGEYMRKYFDVTFRPIKDNGGLIIDLKGDSILAIWRGGRSYADLRRQACNAALGVAQAVNRFNQSDDRLKLPTRIGVHAGQMFLGNIGARDHYAFGVRGDAVNTASRMDGLNKYLHTKIVVSDEVIKDMQGFLTREAGVFQLKGKNQPVTVHELIGRIDEASEAQIKGRTIFADAMEAFRHRAWREAREKFQCLAQSGDDGLAAFYTSLCKEYEVQPPGESWVGIIQVEDK